MSAGSAPPAALLNELVPAIKASPGCLGVETAQTASGKVVIFAWFADRKAVLAWYHGAFHQALQRRFFPKLTPRPPLRNVSDDSGPLMAVASLTLAVRAAFDESTLPISQISIELYRPVTGGLYFGGRFAPESVKVAELRDLTP